MSDAWKLLAEAGVPVGALRPVPVRLPEPVALRHALEAASRELEGQASDVEPLLAWLSAFRHHWPRRFDAVLGTRGTELLHALDARASDRNRYIKLRRIAAQNLSRASLTRPTVARAPRRARRR